jgi:hypothetical protein
VPGSRLEAAVGVMVARARLYERVVHDHGPWGAIVHGQPPYPGAPSVLMHSMTMERHEHGDRVVLTGYLHEQMSGITAVDIWCRGEMMLSWPVDPPRDSPVRITIDLSIEDAELAA